MSGSNGVTKSRTHPTVNVVRCGCGCAREQMVSVGRVPVRTGVTLTEARALGWHKHLGVWVSPVCTLVKESA